MFGLNVTINETFAARDAIEYDRPADATAREDDDDAVKGSRACATRVSLAAMPAFSLHFFESAVTPEGPVPVAAWVSYWRELHGGFEGGAGGHGGRDGAWDAFMANSLTFYAPDLTPFVRRLRGARVPIFAGSYNHTLKICRFHCEAVRLYSASVVVPGTGHLFEVVSEQLDARLRGPFARFPASSCAESLVVRQTVEEMRALWASSGGSMTGGEGGVPDLLLVKLAFAGRVAALNGFLKVREREREAVQIPFSLRGTFAPRRP